MGCQGPDKVPAPKGGPRGWHNLWAQRSCRVPGLQHGLPLGVGLPSPAEPSQPLTSRGQPVPPPQSLAQPGSRTRTGPPPSAPSDAAWGYDSALRNLHPRWAQDWQNRGRAGSQGRDRWVWGSGPSRRHHLQDTARRTSVGAAQPSLPHQAGTAALVPSKDAFTAGKERTLYSRISQWASTAQGRHSWRPETQGGRTLRGAGTGGSRAAVPHSRGREASLA